MPRLFKIACLAMSLTYGELATAATAAPSGADDKSLFSCYLRQHRLRAQAMPETLKTEPLYVERREGAGGHSQVAVVPISGSQVFVLSPNSIQKYDLQAKLADDVQVPRLTTKVSQDGNYDAKTTVVEQTMRLRRLELPNHSTVAVELPPSQQKNLTAADVRFWPLLDDVSDVDYEHRLAKLKASLLSHKLRLEDLKREKIASCQAEPTALQRFVHYFAGKDALGALSDPAAKPSDAEINAVETVIEGLKSDLAQTELMQKKGNETLRSIEANSSVLKAENATPASLQNELARVLSKQLLETSKFIIEHRLVGQKSQVEKVISSCLAIVDPATQVELKVASIAIGKWVTEDSVEAETAPDPTDLQSIILDGLLYGASNSSPPSP